MTPDDRRPAIQPPPPVMPGPRAHELPCCGACGGYLAGDVDACVCPAPRDATPAVDVGVLRERGDAFERLYAAEEARAGQLSEDLQQANDAAERAESQIDAATQAASRATVAAEGALRLLSQLYRAYRVRFPALAHTSRADGATCERCALEEQVEAALVAAGLGVPGDTEPPEPVCCGMSADGGEHSDECREAAAREAFDAPTCPGEFCPMCNGEACNLCGAGCWNNAPVERCEHSVSERHESPLDVLPTAGELAAIPGQAEAERVEHPSEPPAVLACSGDFERGGIEYQCDRPHGHGGKCGPLAAMATVTGEGGA